VGELTSVNHRTDTRQTNPHIDALSYPLFDRSVRLRAQRTHRRAFARSAYSSKRRALGHPVVSAAEVALAWVRSRAGVTSTLIGARTIEQLRSNLASLEITLAPEQFAALTEASTPSLNFPAAVIAEMSPMFGFGGATVDGVELPVWPQLLTHSARY
jgi:Aldo/keto reductase family